MPDFFITLIKKKGVKVSIIHRLKNFYFSIIHSLTFYPLLVLVFYAAFAFTLVALHDTKFSLDSLRYFPWMQIANASHAANIITSLLTGMISLTVFSFSIMMLLLNQAAQNLVPKVLYKLKEDSFIQLVLGAYIGTITYYIILLVNFGQQKEELIVPHLAFFFGIVLAVVNIFLFVYFMHRTSMSIHARKITERIYSDTQNKLWEELEKYHEEEISFENEDGQWKVYLSSTTGYLQSVDEGLVQYLSAKDLFMKIHPVLGEYVVEKMPLFSLNKEVDEEVLENIEAGLTFYSEQRVDENSKFGFRQLTEIAVKALSPGLNDPGTAIFCIEYLTDLFCILITHRKGVYKRDKKGVVRVIGKDEGFEDILFFSYGAIRNYGKKDIQILEALVKSLLKISLHDKELKFRDLLNRYLLAIVDTTKQNISNQLDLDHFNQLTAYNVRQSDYFSGGGYILKRVEQSIH